jgi:riboflavin kinase/FMN adenylyltransferase
MKIYQSLESLPQFKNPAVTLGTFDGVHIGHRKILQRVMDAAKEIDGESVLLTFWPHPRMVLQPGDNSLKLLNTIDEKVALLGKSGIDNLVIIPFTIAFSRMPYLEFIRDVLVNKLGVKHLVVGHDHHFGKNREGNYEVLQECAPLYGFGLEQVSAEQIDGVSVSSSKIRNALQDAETEKANTYLGYAYEVTGKVVHGKKRGKELGYPTANIEVPESYKLIPAEGVYAVLVEYGDKQYRGMANIGWNPTFGDTGKTLEVNIFDFSREIYNEILTVKFLAFLRKEIKFANVNTLIQQIDADKRNVVQFFANP